MGLKPIMEIPFLGIHLLTEDKMLQESLAFYQKLNSRRTIRDFSDKPVDKSVIENCIRTAGTAPSGANMQPWHFVLISDPKIKKQIRIAAEKEEIE